MIRNARRLTALDDEAARRGLRTGLTLPEARARVPDLEVTDADGLADAALLKDIARWCDRYTPLVAFDGAAGLFLDITGCAHLFGGEEALAKDCVRRLGRQGFAARTAIAPTPVAARALCRYSDLPSVAKGEEESALSSLPLDALGLQAETVRGLERTGIKTIGELSGLPRAPVTTRFGEEPLLKLDEALGRLDRPLSPLRPAPLVMAERRFAEPLLRDEDVFVVVEALCRSLSGSLEARGEGARQAAVTLFRTDGHVIEIPFGISRAERQPEKLMTLFRHAFERKDGGIDAGFGFDLIRLSALSVSPFEEEQTGFSGDGTAQSDTAHLIDRLSIRLGGAAVQRLVPQNSHVPQRAQIRQSALAVADAPAAALSWPREDKEDEPLDRPVTFFEQPEQIEVLADVPDGPPVRFRWRRVLYDVKRAEGPERIRQPWWAGTRLSDGRRTQDYYRLEDETGRRFWAFRDGLYEDADAAAPPVWYLCGLFV